MQALPTYLPSQSARRMTLHWPARLLLSVLVATAGCADVGDDTGEDASRLDVNYSGGSSGTGNNTGTSGAAGAGGKPSTGGQAGSDSQPEASVGDASLDANTNDVGPLTDAFSRVDTRIDMSVPEVRSDTSAGPMDAPPEIREAEAGPLCGNGTIDPGEECDDKNTLDFDNCTSLCTDNRPCRECEENNCPHDPMGCTDPDGCTGQPFCNDYPKDEDKALCFAAYACVIRTGCAIENSHTFCFCGQSTPEELVACKEGTFKAKGPCEAEIRAAFKPIHPPPVVDEAAIVNGLIDVASPSGGAMSMAACDLSYCGRPELGGNFECSPTKHPVYDGGVDGGASDATAPDAGAPDARTSDGGSSDGKSPDAE